MTVAEFYNQDGCVFPPNVVVKESKFSGKTIYKGYISDIPMEMLNFHITGTSLKDMDGSGVLSIDKQVLTITVE